MKLKNKKITLIYYFIFCVIWIFIMYKNNPKVTTDLYRHYNRFDFIDFHFKNLYDLTNYYLNVQGDFIFYYLIYFIKKMDLTKKLLPVSVVVIYYGINCILFLKVYKKSTEINKKKSFLLSVLTLGLIFPYLIFSTLRYPLAVSFVSLGGYLILEENKKYGYLILLIGLLTHSGITLIIIIIIFIKLFYQRLKRILSNKKMLIILIISTIFLSLNINDVIILLTKIGLTGIVKKLKNYSYTSNIGLGVSQQIAIGMVFLNYYKLIFQKSITKMEVLLKVIMILILISFPIYRILFIRYTWILAFFSLPYFLNRKITKMDIIVLIITNLISILIYRKYIITILF